MSNELTRNPRALMEAVLRFGLEPHAEVFQADMGDIPVNRAPDGKPAEIMLPDELRSIEGMTRQTPETLLLIVLNIVVSSPDATIACARLRHEIAAWKFQDSDGAIY